jgi:hypothetical protein
MVSGRGVGLPGRRSRGVGTAPLATITAAAALQPGNRRGYIGERSQPAPAGRLGLAAALVTVAAMTGPRALITRRYSKVKGLRARGILSPATPPCQIDRCSNRSPVPGHRGRGTGYVYEHCHQHDYIRGVTCGPGNAQMTLIDARVDTCAAGPRFGACLAWWLRCPTCAAGPPGEPWLTACEYHDAPLPAQLRDLAHTEPGTAARDHALLLLALHGRAIISRRYYRARTVQRAAAHAVLVRLRTSIGGQASEAK